MTIKAGDKIKVVNARLAGGQYKNGDIFTVEQVIRDGDVYVKEHNRLLWEKEYEPYNPVNAGDKVKIVKVGDKVRCNSTVGSNGVLKKGSVYEVIALSTIMKDWVYVRSDKESGYNGLNASEKIEQPFTYLAKDQYEVVEEKPKTDIKPGDKVKLIDKFYEHEKFKGDERWIRKQIASLKGKGFEVKNFSLLADRVSTDKIHFTIPIELLEKVEPDRPVFEAGKSYVFDKTLLDRKPRPDNWEGDADGGSVEFKPGNRCGSVRGYAVVREWCREVEQLPKKPKPGDLFRVVNNTSPRHFFNTGDVVRLVMVSGSGCYVCERSDGRNQHIHPNDLEPYAESAHERLDGKNFSYLCIDELFTTKHRYTDKQIAEAQRIIGEIVAGFENGECFYVLAVTTNGIAIRYRTGMNDCYSRFDSRCSPNDEFNRTIGIMVALCKATGRKLPDWIYV